MLSNLVKKYIWNITPLLCQLEIRIYKISWEFLSYKLIETFVKFKLIGFFKKRLHQINRIIMRFQLQEMHFVPPLILIFILEQLNQEYKLKSFIMPVSLVLLDVRVFKFIDLEKQFLFLSGHKNGNLIVSMKISYKIVNQIYIRWFQSILK